MSSAYSSRYDAALVFAARAHARQTRKGTNIPYIVHPVAVAGLLGAHGWDEDTRIAGLLHDVVEDTPATLGEVERAFGERVAALVEVCTEPPKARPWEERKEEMLARMEVMPASARAVCCADKAHNLNSLADELALGADVWSRFRRGREQQLDYHRRALEALARGFESSILEELRLALGRVR